MATPKSVEQLIREHSKARVLVPSEKVYIRGFEPNTGLPRISRKMNRDDVLNGMVKQYAR